MTKSSLRFDVPCLLRSGGDGSHWGAPGITVDVCGSTTHDLLRASLLELLSADLRISYYPGLCKLMALVVVPLAILGQVADPVFVKSVSILEVPWLEKLNPTSSPA